jgi:hypothetical protein
MGWQAYKVVFRLLSPMHIGYQKVGNIQRTRPYVTGKVIWGALTARLTREKYPAPQRKHYEHVSEEVNQNLAFTYFFPAIDPEAPLYPWYHRQKGLIYGQQEMAVDLFTYLFLGTYASTALDYTHFVAEEGTLHEVEMILPHTRTGEQVYLVGYILAKNGGVPGWKDALGKLQLGGERGYGWGRVKLQGEPFEEERIFGYEPEDMTSWPPRIKLPQCKPILAHALAADFQEGLLGPIEPLVGRETREAKGFGRIVPKAQICWAPGSRITKESGLTVCIGCYGIWEGVK